MDGKIVRFFSGIILLLLVSCTNGVNPTAPNHEGDTSLASSTDSSATDNQPRLWGYYDFYLDLANRKIDVVPNRTMDFSANVVKFLNNDPKGVQLKFNGTK